MPAQGNALGFGEAAPLPWDSEKPPRFSFSPERAKQLSRGCYFALSGLGFRTLASEPQGVALGWRVAPFQGYDGYGNQKATSCI